MAWSSNRRVGVVLASGLDKLEKGLAKIRRLEALMTTWRDDSEISKVNQAAGKQPVIVGPETFEVIEKSLSVTKRSDGVFDISFEAMRDLWRFDENKVEEVPSQEAIDKGRALIDYRKITVDKDKRSVFLEKQGMRIISTAGDYERSFVKDGKRWHHIIDPRSGYPARASRSVTVWAKDAFTADAIDDAIFILGPEKGLSICEELDDCGAVVVDAKNKVWVSKRLESKIQMLRDPTDGV